MSCPRSDLHRFVGILDGWFDDPHMPAIFKCHPKAPTNAKPPEQVDKIALKEAKWGQYRDAVVQRLCSLEEDGWTLVYTDSSSKTVQGWMQGGYGVWFAANSPRNHAAHIPESERKSVSRGELRGGLHAILHRRLGEYMVVVMDSEYVFKGIMEWSPKWQQHGWGIEIYGNRFYGRRKGQGRSYKYTGFRHISGCRAIMKQMQWRKRDGDCTPIINSQCPSGRGWRFCGSNWVWRKCPAMSRLRNGHMAVTGRGGLERRSVTHGIQLACQMSRQARRRSTRTSVTRASAGGRQGYIRPMLAPLVLFC